MPADDALRADLGALTARLQRRLDRLDVRTELILDWLDDIDERIKQLTATAGADSERR